LSKKIQQAGVNVWLVNTGWAGGSYGTGKRMSLKITRALISAALRGDLNEVQYKQHDIFGVEIPVTCPDVPSELLNPRDTWNDKDAYDKKANFLAEAFLKNFEKYRSFANREILSAVPKVHA
jgi:phosphoenolpyruvate carboxykinase (ATP)